tara:strand:- start:261 stop:506 length:246 start_codon:yes stop_codon:yes gene_type:complete
MQSAWMHAGLFSDTMSSSTFSMHMKIHLKIPMLSIVDPPGLLAPIMRGEPVPEDTIFPISQYLIGQKLMARLERRTGATPK